MINLIARGSNTDIHKDPCTAGPDHLRLSPEKGKERAGTW